jgi:hypothetical protein
MLTHIVVWKYRSEVDQSERQEHIRRLQSLSEIIPEVESLTVGSDVLHLQRSYDTGLVATFADREALDAYTVHPEHMKVADLGRGLSAHVVSVDFIS